MPQARDLGPDEGYVQIQICGVAMTVCPNEELENIHARLGDATTGQPMLQKIREYIAERTKAYGDEKRVSSSMARRYYETLLEAERDVSDFFGFTRSSQGSSDSSQPTSAETKTDDSSSEAGQPEKSEGT